MLISVSYWAFRHYYNAARISYPAVSGNESEALIIYKDTGDPATSPLIALIDSAKSPKDCEYIRQMIETKKPFSEEKEKAANMRIDTKLTELLSAPAVPEGSNG